MTSIKIILMPAWLKLSLSFNLSFAVLFAGGQLPPLPSFNAENFPASSRSSIEELYKDLLREPRNPYANGRLGMWMHAFEQYALAETLYARAQLLDPTSFEWPYYLGIVQSLLGKKQESVLSLEKALKHSPRYLPGQLRLVKSLVNTGRISEAIKLVRNLLHQHSEVPLAHYELARALVAQGQKGEAIDHLQKACRLYEQFGAAHYTLAMIYRDLGKEEMARKHLDLHRAHADEWPPLDDFLLQLVKDLRVDAAEHLNRGIQLGENGQIEEAIDEHKKVLEMDPEMVQAHIHLISLYARANRIAEAELHYRKAVEINPNLPESHYNFGVLLSSLGKYEEAARAFRKALTANPRFPDAHNNLGYMLEMEGKLEEAAQHYRDALNEKPDYRLARFNLGRVLVAQNKNREAVDQFLRTLSPEDESTPRFMYALAAAYVRVREFRKAIFYAEEAKQRALSFGQQELAEQIEIDLNDLNRRLNPE